MSPQQIIAKQNSELINTVPSSAASSECIKLIGLLIDACCTQLSLVNSGIIGPKTTKFIQDTDQSSLLVMHLSALQSYNRFWNATMIASCNFYINDSNTFYF